MISLTPSWSYVVLTLLSNREVLVVLMASVLFVCMAWTITSIRK